MSSCRATNAKPPRRPGKATRGGRAAVSADEPTERTRSTAEPTTAQQLREHRKAAGVSLSELARIIAASTGHGVEAWRVALTDYEAGRKVPTSERVALILEALRAGRARLLPVELARAVARLVERYGAPAVRDELRVSLDLMRVLTAQTNTPQAR